MVASLHQKHIDGLSAKLDIETKKLAKETEAVEKAQANKLQEHQQTLKKMEAENAKLQQLLKGKQDEVEAQTKALATVRDDAALRQKVLTQASEAADLQWKQRKQQAEELLADLRKQPALLQAENDAKVAAMQAELDKMQAAHAEEADAMIQHHKSIKEEIKAAEDEYASLPCAGVDAVIHRTGHHHSAQVGEAADDVQAIVVAVNEYTHAPASLAVVINVRVRSGEVSPEAVAHDAA